MSGRWLSGLLLSLFHCQLVLAQTVVPASTATAPAQVPVRVDQEHHHRVVLQNSYIRVLDGHW